MCLQLKAFMFAVVCRVLCLTALQFCTTSTCLLCNCFACDLIGFPSHIYLQCVGLWLRRWVSNRMLYFPLDFTKW